jgi:hypothetical protein
MRRDDAAMSIVAQWPYLLRARFVRLNHEFNLKVRLAVIL